MEFKDQANLVRELVGATTFEDLPSQLMEIVLNNDTSIYDKYLEIVGDDTNFLNSIYQYYLADREELKQDFTPPSISKLLSVLTNHDKEEIVYDMCAGTGSLTLAKNLENEFILHELNTETISSLLFNLALHNISGFVINGDVITNETKKIYSLSKGDKYSAVEEIEEFKIPEYDTVISNPPFNLKAEKDIKFKSITVKKNVINYAFVFRALEKLKDTGVMAFILPNGVLTSAFEESYRKILINKKLLRAVISIPGGMFEQTSIPTVILLLSKEKNKEISFITVSECDDKITINKRGTGKACHTNRIYHKELNSLSEEQITDIRTSILEQMNIPGFSKTVPFKEVVNQDYALSPNRYLDFTYEIKHRSFDEIIDDINWVTDEMNQQNVTLNLTIAKKYGWDVYAENQKKRNRLIDKINEDIYLFSPTKKLRNESWVTITRSAKNEIKNKNPKELTKSFETALQNQQIMINYLDGKQKDLMRELRDAMIPKLMSGEIDVSDIFLEPENEEPEPEPVIVDEEPKAQTTLF